MEGMNPEQIERVFGALARIEQKIDGHAETMESHARHDETVHAAIFARVETLQLSHARQKGFITAVASLAGLLSAGVVYTIQKILGSH